MILAKVWRLRALSCAALAALLAGCNPPAGDLRARAGKVAGGEAGNAAGSEDKPYQIVMVPDDAAPAFQQEARRGAEAAARKYNARIIWAEARGADKNKTVERQKKIVEEATAEKADGLIVAPLDATELVIPINRAAKARIPVVVFKTNANTNDRLTLVASDNFAAGQQAAERLARLVGENGSVGVLPPAANTPALNDRLRGFRSTLEKSFSAVRIVSLGETASAAEVRPAMVSAFLASHPQLKGLFAPDETATMAALRALQERKMTGRIKLAGIALKGNPIGIANAGQPDVLIVPKPYEMGYASVQAIIDFHQFRRVPSRLDIAVEARP